MILTRYLYREITGLTLALLSILMLVFLSTRFIRYLTEAGAGGLPVEFISKLIALKVLVVLSIILPLAFFLALLLTLGRMYAEQEIVIMSACGAGLPFLMRRIMGYALGMALVIGGISLYIAPWANQMQELLFHQARSLAEVTGISAGRFKHFDQGRGFFYIEDLDQERGRMQNVFVSLDRGGKKVLITAEAGFQEIDKGDGSRYLVLENGRRYEGLPGQAEAVITHFGRHSIRVTQGAVETPPQPAEALPSWALWGKNTPPEQVEMQMRLSAPLSVVLLAPLALLLSHTKPRQSRYAKVFIAIMIFFAYRNLLQVSGAWVERAYLPVWVGLWWVHALLGFVVAVLLWRRRRI